MKKDQYILICYKNDGFHDLITPRKKTENKSTGICISVYYPNNNNNSEYNGDPCNDFSEVIDYIKNVLTLKYNSIAVCKVKDHLSNQLTTVMEN